MLTNISLLSNFPPPYQFYFRNEGLELLHDCQGRPSWRWVRTIYFLNRTYTNGHLITQKSCIFQPQCTVSEILLLLCISCVWVFIMQPHFTQTMQMSRKILKNLICTFSPLGKSWG